MTTPRGALCAVVFALLCAAGAARAEQPPATAPATRPADESLWREMSAVDAIASKVTELTADFEQKKFTALLRKPIVSTGRIVAKHEKVLSITRQPEPTSMLIDGREIRLYYPRQHVMEIYPIDGDLAALASSPLPRLDVLKRFFSFARLTGDADGAADAGKLALKLTPIDALLSEHVQEVHVLLDRQRGLVDRVETFDPDGDRTVLTFRNVKTGGIDEEPSLDVPPDTRISRPLEGAAAEQESR